MGLEKILVAIFWLSLKAVQSKKSMEEEEKENNKELEEKRKELRRKKKGKIKEETKDRRGWS